MIDEALSGRHVPPAEMEVAHDAISIAYCLLHRHGDVFIGAGGGAEDSSSNPKTTAPAASAAAAAFADLVLALTRSLRERALSREAAISAGVSIAAAAGVGATPAAHAAVLADAFFPRRDDEDGGGGGGGAAPSGAFYLTLVPIRSRRRGERRSLRTFPGASLRPGSLAFNTRPRRLSTPSDAFQLQGHRSTPSRWRREGRACASRRRRSRRSEGSPRCEGSSPRRPRRLLSRRCRRVVVGQTRK